MTYRNKRSNGTKGGHHSGLKREKDLWRGGEPPRFKAPVGSLLTSRSITGLTLDPDGGDQLMRERNKRAAYVGSLVLALCNRMQHVNVIRKSPMAFWSFNRGNGVDPTG